MFEYNLFFCYHIQVREIFSSNSLPYLIDCYIKNDGIDSTKKLREKKEKQQQQAIMEEQKYENSNDNENVLSPLAAASQNDNPNGTNFEPLSPQIPMKISSSFKLKKGKFSILCICIKLIFVSVNDILNERRWIQQKYPVFTVGSGI